MNPNTRRLTSSTGILVQAVQDLEDFTDDPDKYLVDLYADEHRAVKVWMSAGASDHFTYNDGAITLAWDGIPLLGVPDWHDICTLWTYLVNVVEGYLATGRGASFFPGQPTPIVLERIHGGALVTIGDTRARVDPSTFCRELLDEAGRFWQWVERHDIPLYGEPELARIDQMQARVP
ncbi:hypothetical protein [Arthrobacter antioxidans]|uniref:hypothetical protein n=1 Tax=Arthrobacter antioxidans TaxID=2895818 RepID=UPI001FFFD95C|nr:hypothetical protein [Arthrobacter antioxidans]